MARKIIEFFDAKWRAALLIVTGLIGLLLWSNRAAVKSYKDNQDEDANRRASNSIDAASDAGRLSPSDRAKRMQSKGWFRD